VVADGQRSLHFFGVYPFQGPSVEFEQHCAKLDALLGELVLNSRWPTLAEGTFDKAGCADLRGWPIPLCAQVFNKAADATGETVLSTY
jgi:hypothetical protein